MAQIGSIYVALDVDIGRVSRFRTAANMIERDSALMRRSLGNTSRSVHTLRESFNRNQRIRLFGDSLRTITRTNDEIQRMRASLVALSAVAGGGLTGALSAAYLLQTADRARLLRNQIRTVTESNENLIATEERLYALSQRTRSSLNSTTTIYARTARATEFLSISQEKLLRITETIQKAFAVGGATQAESFGAAVQLSQGIASDRFSGEEFRSVSENAPVLLNAMAKSLDVNIGKLREMAHAGELTAKAVTTAILASGEEIDKAFAKTSITVGQSITRLDNAFLTFIGDIDETYGVTRRLAEAISNLAENFDEIASYGGTAIAIGASALAGRGASGLVSRIADDIQMRRKVAMAEMEELRKQQEMIRERRAQINKQFSSEVSKSSRTIREIYAQQAGRVHDATESQYTAQERVKKLEKYRQTIDQAQKSMKDLSTSTGQAFDTKKAQKMAASIDALDTRIIKAKVSLQQASDAVTRAQAGETQALGKAIQVRENAFARMAKLQAEAKVLSDQSVKMTSAMVVAQRQATVAMSAIAGIRSAMGSVYGFLGGGPGVLFTAAIIGFLQYSKAAARAEERTNALKTELRELGLLAEGAAKAFDDTSKSIEDLEVEELKRKITSVQDELDRVRGSQNPFDMLFNYDEEALGNILKALRAVERTRGMSRSNTDKAAAKELRELLEGFDGSASSAALIGERLSEISKIDLSDRMIELVDHIRNAVEFTGALTEQVKNLNRELNRDTGIKSIPDFVQQLNESDKMRRSGQEFLDERNRGEYFDMTEFERSIEKAADKLVEAAEKAGETLPRYMAERQARFDEMYGRSTKSVKDLIGFAEGTDKGRGYNETLDYGRWTGGDVNLVGMTLREVLKLQSQMRTPENRALYGDGKGSSAVGRYQIVSTTLRDLIKDLGLNLNEFFSPELQDRLADELIRRSGGTVGGMRGTWEGLKNIPPERIRAALDASSVDTPGRDETDQSRIDLRRQQAMATMENVQAIELERASLTKSSLERERAAKIMELENAFRSQNIPLTADVRAAIAAEAEAYAKATTELQNYSQVQELVFERQQMFRSPAEQRVASTLRELGLPVDSAQGEMIAQQIRFNEQLMFSRDLAHDFASSFVEDMRNGVPVVEALTNALDRFLSKLIDAGLENGINAIFSNLAGQRGVAPSGGGGGNGFLGTAFRGIGSLFGFRGFSSGGYTGDTGGIVHPKEFVINRGVVAKPGMQAALTRLNATGRMGNGTTINYAPTFNTQGADAKQVAELRRQVDEQARTFKQQVVGASTEYQDRNWVGAT